MIITKRLARRLSIKLLEKEYKAIDKFVEEMNKVVHVAYLLQIPKEVLEFSEKHKQFFTFSYSIKLPGSRGKESQWFSVPNKSTVLCNQSAHRDPIAVLKAATQVRKTINALNKKQEKAKAEYNRTRYQTEQMLLSFRTYKKALAALPILAEHLPTVDNVPPKIIAQPPNFKKLKTKLQKINSK